MASLRDLPLEAGRLGLLKWIDQAHPQGSVNNQVTIVFDGHPDYFGGSSQGSIRVIFSDGCSADDKIKQMVDDDQDRKNCIVVSNDKDVYLYARSLGARVMSVKAFTAKPRVVQSQQDWHGKQISLGRQEKINKELSELWLKEKE